MNRLIRIAIFAIVFIFSCVKNEREQVDVESDKAFFPLQVGKFLEYEVDSILFRQGKFLDSVHTFIREEIISQSRDSLGEIFFILRSNKKTLTQPWVPSASYSGRILEQKVIRNESNLHFIKLVFPILKNQTWNGLALIKKDQDFNVEGESIAIYEGWEFFKTQDGAHPEKIGLLNFNDVITVLQTDAEDILAKRYSIEKYTKGVGLVYRECHIFDCNDKVNTCTNTVPWTSRATKGFRLKQWIIRYN